MAGWNLELPTWTELVLWRVASGIQLGTIVSGWLTMPFGIVKEDFQAWMKSRTWLMLPKWINIKRWTWLCLRNRQSPRQGVITTSGNDNLEKWRMLNGNDPNWRASIKLLAVYQFTWIIYLFARLYIIAEDGASLRAMPPTAFQTVEWSRYLPHL